MFFLRDTEACLLEPRFLPFVGSIAALLLEPSLSCGERNIVIHASNLAMGVSSGYLHAQLLLDEDNFSLIYSLIKCYNKRAVVGFYSIT